MEDEPFIDVDLTKVSSEIVNVPTQKHFHGPTRRHNVLLFW